MLELLSGMQDLVRVRLESASDSSSPRTTPTKSLTPKCRCLVYTFKHLLSVCLSQTCKPAVSEASAALPVPKTRLKGVIATESIRFRRILHNCCVGAVFCSFAICQNRQNHDRPGICCFSSRTVHAQARSIPLSAKTSGVKCCEGRSAA